MEHNQFPDQEELTSSVPVPETAPQEPVPEAAPTPAGDTPFSSPEALAPAPEEPPLNLSLWADDPAFLELLVPEGQAPTQVSPDPMPEEAVLQEPSLPEDQASAPEEAVPALEEEPVPEEIPDAGVPALTDEKAPDEQPEPLSQEDADSLPEEYSPNREADPLAQELQEVAELLEDKPDHSKFQETEEDPEAFAQMVNTQTQPKPIPAREHPTRKGRPRRKKGEGLFGIPNILSTLVWLAITLAIGVTLGRMLWVCAADVLAFGREDRVVTITIYESDTIDDIANKLHQNNLIRYPGLFKLYAKLAVDDGEIRPGIWDLNTRYDYHALVNMMSPSSNRKVVEVMIPEGYSCRQIFALLEENKVCTAADLAAYAATGELDEYWFLEGITRGEANCLEGFLFPDTYQFYTNDSPRNVLQKMLDNFDVRMTEPLQTKLDGLNAHITEMMVADGRSQEYIDAHLFTVQDVVIVASLIEKETSSAEEGYTIASVIYNRLFRWGSTPAYLNIDAAMVYALNKTDITAEDLRIDHPYNTYLYTGLTPGPISNPGMSSLMAALEPANSNYYYYVLDPAAGNHHFSTTYEEHQAFIASLGD